MTHIKSVKGQQAYARRNLKSLGKTATYKVYRMVEKAKGGKH